MRATEIKRPKEWASVERLRELCDERFRVRGTNRTEALRRVDMSNTTFERLLREGLSNNPRTETVKRLSVLGVLDIVPRR